MATEDRMIYWYRELPPIDAEPIGEGTLEAASERVPGTLAHRDELWERCYANLMTQVSTRLQQEVARARANYAHVLKESVDSKRDDVTTEAWLHGSFTYVIYRQPVKR
jgi:hypothetical protein